jgi:PucR-like helix-turn-helix protein/diguanylate cyclase with GGDEF domain
MRARPDWVSSQSSASARGADSSAPRATPLTLVAGAVAGGDLQSVASTAAGALERPVMIAIPALCAPVLAPPGSLAQADTDAILQHAGAVIAGVNGSVPDAIAEAVPVQIGDQVVGIVVAAGAAPPSADGTGSSLEQRAWLEAAAAAASVTALIRETHDAADSAQALLTELAAAPPRDPAAFLARARRLGHELSSGAVAICGWPAVPVDGEPPGATEVAALGSDGGSPALVASRPGGRVLALAPMTDGHPSPAELAELLRAGGFEVCMSSPRRDPALLYPAVVEAELLVELAAPSSPAGQDETYRLLIGVLLRDRSELEQLREHTITPLADYDARHDTELLATLRAFLTHDGSTTETAEAMSLHRHTVGYRLARVHEVSGLSPYESDGRERLSLGIKAQQILEAEGRRR